MLKSAKYALNLVIVIYFRREESLLPSLDPADAAHSYIEVKLLTFYVRQEIVMH